MQKFLILCLILGIAQTRSLGSSNDGTVRISVESYYNTMFAATITLDEEEDTFLKVMFDTSTSDFWLPSADCSTSPWCRRHDHYNFRESTSYVNAHRNFSTLFSGAAVSGRVGIDQVMLGDAVLKNREFGEALEIGQLDDYTNLYDGVLGLGTSYKSSTGTPVIYTMLEAGLLDDAVYSFTIDKVAKDKPEIVGELVIGSVDHAAYSGPITWGKVLTEASWTTTFDSVIMGNDVISAGSIAVECSTSNPLLVGPNSQVEKIYKLLGAKDIPSVTIRTVDCDRVGTFPALTFILNGVKIEIPASDYVMEESGYVTKFCYLAITAYEEPQEEKWIFGSMVHKPVYIVYNFGIKSLGFAQAARNATSLLF